MTNNLPPDSGSQPQYAPDALLTLIEVSVVTGRNIKTVKVWNDKGKGRWPNAVQDTTGRNAWRVPVSDLVAAGDLDPSQIAHVHNELAGRRESREIKDLREQLIRLEEQLLAARGLADERANTINLLKTVIRKGGAA